MNSEESKDQLLKVARLLERISIARDKEALKNCKIEHKFWNSQPVVKPEEVIDKEGPIALRTIDMTPTDPNPLPKDFEWVTVDLETRIQQVYELLSNNYVEDDSETFRFDYSAEFLKW